jgi:CO dehydrogenase maturation factor
MESPRPLLGKRIGILGKGGSGKSTVTVLLAEALRAMEYEICVLDADSTNMGLERAFGLQRAPASLIDFFGGCVFYGGSVSCPVDDPSRLPEAEISLEKLPPAYFAQSREGLYLLTTGKFSKRGPGAGCDGPVAKIARDLRLSIGRERPVTLIDFKAGLEDSARGVLTSLDWAVAVVDPSSTSMQVAVDLKATIEGIRRGELPATAHLRSSSLIKLANQIYQNARIRDMLVVLNRIRNQKTADLVTRRLQQSGITPIGVIHEDPKISMAWLEGSKIENSNTQMMSDVTRALEDEGRKEWRKNHQFVSTKEVYR